MNVKHCFLVHCLQLTLHCQKYSLIYSNHFHGHRYIKSSSIAHYHYQWCNTHDLGTPAVEASSLERWNTLFCLENWCMSLGSAVARRIVLVWLHCESIHSHLFVIIRVAGRLEPGWETVYTLERSSACSTALTDSLWPLECDVLQHLASNRTSVMSGWCTEVSIWLHFEGLFLKYT